MRRNFEMTETRLLVAAAQAGDELAAIQLLAGRERAAGGWLPQMRIRPARANGRLALVAHGARAVAA